MNNYKVKAALGNRLLIKCDVLEKTLKKEGEAYKTKGGIYLPAKNEIAEQENRRQEGAETGVIVDMGYMAFKGLGDGTAWANVGDRVGFKRYAGINPYPDGSPDGFIYRCIDDEDICVLLETIDTSEEVGNVTR